MVRTGRIIRQFLNSYADVLAADDEADGDDW